MAQANPSLIAELERATHNGSHDCAETVQRVTDLFLAGADRFTEDQVLLFENVLGFLVQKIETRARAELSTRLALVSNAPSRVIRRLALDDEIMVAEPVLAGSPRLTADDLDSGRLHQEPGPSHGHFGAPSHRRKRDRHPARPRQSRRHL